MDAVRMAFKPEFLNRLDDVVVFDALGMEELSRIVDLQVARAGEAAGGPAAHPRRSRRRRGSGWSLTGYDPAYGARPLRRLVQREIGDRLAKALLAGEIRDGDHVVVDTAAGPDGVGAGLVVGRGAALATS